MIGIVLKVNNVLSWVNQHVIDWIIVQECSSWHYSISSVPMHVVP